MSNMSYCRFRNTLNDLRDCSKHMDDDEDLSEDESNARDSMMLLCARIVHANAGRIEELEIEKRAGQGRQPLITTPDD